MTSHRAVGENDFMCIFIGVAPILTYQSSEAAVG
jgi:hypothetical protein